MNKSMKKFISLALGAISFGTVVLPVAGCTKNNGGGTGTQKYDPETKPLVFSTDALDGNFNPFFATSATDVTIAAQTQISMISANKAGEPVCGEDEATVARDYKIDDTVQGETTYSFIIKNDIKFWDGTPLTIKDVLFNLYVYLDPMYMGSSTIYSTKIKGLNQYRYQNPDLTDDSDTDALDSEYEAKARARATALRNYLKDGGTATEQVEKDLAKAKELFREEVESDWTLCSLETYQEEFSFTEKWQAFYYMEGLVGIQTKMQDNGNEEALKDTNGKYLTDFDPDENGELAVDFKGEMNAQLTADKIAAAKTKYSCNDEEAKEYIKQEFAIEKVYNNYSGTNSKLYNVLSSWATATEIITEFTREERSAAFEAAQNNNQMLVESVSGITTSTATRDFKGKALREPHDVLNITINGVDPKAIWNFAFTVAPRHYYSNAETLASTPFGVKFGDQKFFDEVLQAPEKNKLPRGAGVYQACNQFDKGEVTGDNFFVNNWVYFKRNEYFETVGEDLNNAYIKYMQYKVVGSEQIINSLVNEEIHVGSPNAKPANISKVDEYKTTLSKATYRTNGYGYVGINPKAVPDIEVRQAIMKAMNTASIVSNYYTPALADVVYRSMSTESWAYPKVNGNPITVYDPEGDEFNGAKYEKNKNVIKDLVESAGANGGNTWTRKGGIYTNQKGEKLKLTFTIAGESKDHPAYQMFMDTADFLNTCGFDITVTTDVTALKKLAKGELQVWAAAWSSSIDPDLYQVFHKDSTATSVLNWGYPQIFADPTDTQFAQERTIINELSAKIEEARTTDNRTLRTEDYAEALDMVMSLYVELPTYQRNDLVVYNKKLINVKTINQNASSNEGVFDRLWEVNYN